MEFEIGEVRMMMTMMAPMADFDGAYTFYYDETNNIKKFYVRENDFNYAFTANFVLGGLVHEGQAPDIKPLFDSFKLQANANEVKFKHIANGNFLDCLKSKKLRLYLEYILNSSLYVHYSSLNILYWSIADIVDSAIAEFDGIDELELDFANRLKNDLYKLSKLEIDAVIDLFYKFKYPNIGKDEIISFVDSLFSLFEKYINTQEYHFGLGSLKQLLKQAKKKGSLPFVMDEEDYILLKDLSHFYLRPIYLFKNSRHVFDNEDSIAETVGGYKILVDGEEVKNYVFVDSKSSQLVQASDIFIGLMGKFTGYINTSSRE